MQSKLLFFILFLSFTCSFFTQIVLAQKTNLSETKKIESLNQELNTIKEKIETIEKNKLVNDHNQTEYIKQTLNISSDTVKFVGTIGTIVLTLIIFLIGYQVIRSYQFEKEIREIRKLMIDEYQKMMGIRVESEKLINDIKSKMGNLEGFVGELATNFLDKTTSNLVSELKEQAKQALGEIKTKDDEMNRSIELMKKLETLDLTLTPSVYAERGIIYTDQGNTGKALENFNKAIELKANNFEAYFHRARVYHKMHNFKEAINDYMKAIEINPNEPASSANIGICYREKPEPDYEKSLQNLTKAIELYPKYEFAYIQRALTYSKMKKYDLTINDFKEAEKLNPNSLLTLTDIGLYYTKIGNFDSAIEYYFKAIEKKKTLATIQNLTEAYICKKDFINAEKWANESYSMSTDDLNKVISKFLLVITLILNNKEYKIELKSIIDTLKKMTDFTIEGWSFEELLRCLTDSSISQEKAELVKKLIALLKKEIKPEDFRLT
jgi:tetratricopeptide (TPR) repeat protein